MILAWGLGVGEGKGSVLKNEAGEGRHQQRRGWRRSAARCLPGPWLGERVQVLWAVSAEQPEGNPGLCCRGVVCRANR